MKKVKIKKGTRICSREMKGCGRVIKQGEYAWMQETKGKRRRYKRRYLCLECYDKVTY